MLELREDLAAGSFAAVAIATTGPETRDVIKLHGFTLGSARVVASQSLRSKTDSKSVNFCEVQGWT